MPSAKTILLLIIVAVAVALVACAIGAIRDARRRIISRETLERSR